MTPSEPDLVATSRDGVRIAAFRSGRPDAPPLLLIHGASADHTTFRVLGPLLSDDFDLVAIDRRGRGASGDVLPYAIEREFEDVAAVASAVADRLGVDTVDAFGHSYGGRCALGAALVTDRIRRVISYEGAPALADEHYGDASLVDDLAQMATDGRLEDLFIAFLARAVGMSAADIAAYRADPVWPRRVAAAGTIARELAVEAGDAANLDRLGLVRQPVLQLLGGASLATFATATHALQDRLADGRVVVIPGARHAAHHTHPRAVAEAVRAFLLPLAV